MDPASASALSPQYDQWLQNMSRGHSQERTLSQPFVNIFTGPFTSSTLNSFPQDLNGASGDTNCNLPMSQTPVAQSFRLTSPPSILPPVSSTYGATVTLSNLEKINDVGPSCDVEAHLEAQALYPVSELEPNPFQKSYTLIELGV